MILTLTTTHVAVIILVGIVLRLDKNEWFAAFLLGVAIDADHLFAAPQYISSNGWGAILRPSWDDGSGMVWRSLLHEPVGAFVVAPVAIGWRFLVPLLFWSSHVFIDWFQGATIAFSAPIELAVIAASVAGIVWMLFARWRELQPEGADFRGFLAFARRSVRSYLS